MLSRVSPKISLGNLWWFPRSFAVPPSLVDLWCVGFMAWVFSENWGGLEVRDPYCTWTVKKGTLKRLYIGDEKLPSYIGIIQQTLVRIPIKQQRISWKVRRGSLSEEVFASGRYLWGIFEEISRLLKYRNNQFGEKTSLMIWATHLWREMKEPPQLIMFTGMFS